MNGQTVKRLWQHEWHPVADAPEWVCWVCGQRRAFGEQLPSHGCAPDEDESA